MNHLKDCTFMRTKSFHLQNLLGKNNKHAHYTPKMFQSEIQQNSMWPSSEMNELKKIINCEKIKDQVGLTSGAWTLKPLCAFGDRSTVWSISQLQLHKPISGSNPRSRIKIEFLSQNPNRIKRQSCKSDPPKIVVVENKKYITTVIIRPQKVQNPKKLFVLPLFVSANANKDTNMQIELRS